MINYVLVNKTDDVSTIPNGTFVYCKELLSGFMKRDLSPLNLESTTFENVIAGMDAVPYNVLAENGLDAIVFGGNDSDLKGQMVISHKIQQNVEETIVSLATSTEKTNFLDLKKLFRRYFDYKSLSAAAAMVLVQLDRMCFVPSISSNDLTIVSENPHNNNGYFSMNNALNNIGVWSNDLYVFAPTTINSNYVGIFDIGEGNKFDISEIPLSHTAVLAHYGTIKRFTPYTFSVSDDNTSWSVIASGTKNSEALEIISTNGIKGRYFKIELHPSEDGWAFIQFANMDWLKKSINSQTITKTEGGNWAKYQLIATNLVGGGDAVVTVNGVAQTVESTVEGFQENNIALSLDGTSLTEDLKGNSLTVYNDVTLSNEKILFGTNNNDTIDCGSSTAWSMGSGDFYIGFKYTPVSKVASYPRILQFGSYWSSGDTFCILDRHNSYSTKFTVGKVTTNGFLESTTTVTDGVEYFIEVYRENGIYYLAINGVVEDSNNESAGLGDDTLPVGLHLGNSTQTRDESVNGYLDDLVIVKGSGSEKTITTFTEQTVDTNELTITIDGSADQICVDTWEEQQA